MVIHGGSLLPKIAANAGDFGKWALQGGRFLLKTRMASFMRLPVRDHGPPERSEAASIRDPQSSRSRVSSCQIYKPQPGTIISLQKLLPFRCAGGF